MGKKYVVLLVVIIIIIIIILDGIECPDISMTSYSKQNEEQLSIGRFLSIFTFGPNTPTLLTYSDMIF